MEGMGDHQPHIFISIAEQSADEHAAALVRAFRNTNPDATFNGLVGPALKAEGCDCFADLTDRSAMAGAALLRVPEMWMLLRRLKAHVATTHYDAAVLVDSPALNLPIAKIFHQRGIPVLYYIAPQTWAWGPRGWRNARIKKRIDRLACLWPFEEPYFKEAGIEAHYVGHPTIERLMNTKPDDARLKQLKTGASPIVTILPGSRTHVVEEVFPGQLEIVRSLAMRFRSARFLVVAAKNELLPILDEMISYSPDRDRIEMLCGETDRTAAIRAADLALVASGTVTLEVAYHATPMIVMYNANPWVYRLIGRWLITTPHLSLPNILAGKRIVPEFMPYYRSTSPIIAKAIEWLSTPATLARVRRDLQQAIDPLRSGGAAQSAASQLTLLLSGASEPELK
jgi:lipid-A-disaccharide synthase